MTEAGYTFTITDDHVIFHLDPLQRESDIFEELSGPEYIVRRGTDEDLYRLAAVMCLTKPKWELVPELMRAALEKQNAKSLGVFNETDIIPTDMEE